MSFCGSVTDCFGEWLQVGTGLFWYHKLVCEAVTGTLRFYMSTGTDEMFKITDEAENASDDACDDREP